MMSEFILPGIKLEDDKYCDDCPCYSWEIHGCNFNHDLDPEYDPYSDDKIILRPHNCPLQPVKPFLMIPQGIALNVSNEPGVIMPVKSQPRCGDCVHHQDWNEETSERYCTMVDKRTSIDWHCADFVAKEKE